MTNFLRKTSLATVAAVALTATPALAVGPNQNATATARIVKPLTLTWVRDLDLGTIVLSGAAPWSGAAVTLPRGGTAVTCTNTNVTCSGAVQTAQYKVTGTNNQTVQVSAPNFNLTGPGGATLPFTVDGPGTISLGNSGATGVTFDLGGSVTVDSTTADGTYSGTFNVTVNY
jgi:hypothetical protein